MCTCYVQTFSASERFALRWGAHSLKCEKYREGQDPVDRAQDEALRDEYLNGPSHHFRYA